MYGTLTIATLDQNQEQQLVKNLDSQVVQEVSQLPGFLGAYFTEPQNGTGFSFTLWESQSDAENATQQFQPGTSPMPGALITFVATREIINQSISEQGVQQVQQASQQSNSQQAAQQTGS